MSVRAALGATARRAAASPSLRLVVAGGILFAASAWNERRSPAAVPAVERQPVVISAPRVRALESGFAAQYGRSPSAPERSALVEQAALDEILYREARLLALGLDDASVRLRLRELMRSLGERPELDDDTLIQRALDLGLDDDVVIRRLLAEKMRLVLQRDPAPIAVSDADLETVRERRRAELEQPETITLEQVFVASDGRSTAEVSRGAARLLAGLRSGALATDDAVAQADPLPLGGTLRAQPRLKVQARFGKAFADDVFALGPGTWSEPIASPYGLHLVRVVRREPPRLPSLDELRPALIETVRRERARDNLARGLRHLRGLYEVRIEGADVAQSSSPTSTTTSSLQAGGDGLLASASQPLRRTSP